MNVSPRLRAALRRKLLAWYDAHRRALPWRFPQGAADPYRVWIAEVLLQQTQVRSAIPYYERFLTRFPTLEALARSREEDVLALWGGLGYYARGRNLHAAARETLRRHGGLPASLEALRALPGFGPYTAGAVASIAFAIPAPAVDGNVSRVLTRLFLVAGDPLRARTRARVGALAASLVDPKRPGDLNQALMDLGATVCGRAAPACPRCPIAAHCRARAAGRAQEVPPPRRRPRRRRAMLAVAIARRGDEILFARRPPRGLFAGLLSPPFVEVTPGDDPEPALGAALLKEHGLRARVKGELAACERALTHRDLDLRAIRCEVRDLPEGRALRFALLPEAAALGLPSAMQDLLGRL